MFKKDFFGPFFKKKVRFFIKKNVLQEKLPRGFEITIVIYEKRVIKKRRDNFVITTSF